MKSFGSTLNRAGSTVGNNQNTGLWKSKKNGFLGKLSNSISKSVGSAISSGVRKAAASVSGGIPEDNDKYYDLERDVDDVYSRYYDVSAPGNINNNQQQDAIKDIFENKNTGRPATEDTTKWDQSVTDQMNWYNFSAGAALNSYDIFSEDGSKKGEWLRQAEIEPVVHSLFNPYYGIIPKAMLPGQFIAAQESWGDTSSLYNNLGDCRISTLVNMSKYKSTLLGQARYKYADFMFCKELGMPNNHLITLRRYATPIGDMIMGSNSVDTDYYTVKTTRTATSSKDKSSNTTTKTVRMYSNTAQLADVGHICCYFGGEDNKLEDILKYSFKSTFKELNSEIQRRPSEEDTRESPLGRIINSTSRNYASHMANSSAGSNNIIKWGANNYKGPGGGVIQKLFGSKSWYEGAEALYHVDKNKVYEPKNTIQQMDAYEGKLQFTHEFTLVFSYKMRAYDNISPKAAMLDLLANVTRVCYNKGKFWGGAKQINGPQPNPSGWNKANAFIDNAWDKLGSGIEAFLTGGVDFQELLGNLGNALQGLCANVANQIQSIFSGGLKGAGQVLVDKFKHLDSKFGIADQLKGALKDSIGRPALYVWDSLLSGDNTGMWHLTIGNPLQPIVTIGNLEVTNTEIQHLGPLGIDDFPTELKVTVSLKHARPRDAVSIEKMYMMGGRAIYRQHVRNKPSKIYNVFADGVEQASKNWEKQKAKEEADNDAALKKAQEDQKTEERARQNRKKNQEEQSQSNQSSTDESKQQEKDSTTVNMDYEITGSSTGFAELDTGEYNGYTSGLDYIGEFDYERMRGNMNELA